MIYFIQNRFLSDISGTSWGQFFQKTDDLDMLVNNWSSLLSFFIDKNTPLNEIRVSERYCPWISTDVKRLMRARDRLKTAVLKRNSKILMDAYKQARNRVNSLNIQLKRRYSSAKISECKGNMKESWKTIKELLNKRSKSSNIDHLRIQSIPL